MKPSITLITHGDEWMLIEEHEKIVDQVRQQEYSRGYNRGIMDAWMTVKREWIRSRAEEGEPPLLMTIKNALRVVSAGVEK